MKRTLIKCTRALIFVEHTYTLLHIFGSVCNKQPTHISLLEGQEGQEGGGESLGAFTATGDLASLSPVLAEDFEVAHAHERNVLARPLVTGLTGLTDEALLILLFGVLLCGWQAGLGAQVTARQLCWTLTTVRISSDSLFGAQAAEQCGGVGHRVAALLLLAACSWLHWHWLSVATAIIVYRALRPQRQIVSSPVCLIDEKASQVTIQRQLATAPA